ncbi:hypothetical protein GYMLUDRAFT_69503 [Collybiopsis luxurians FD-317 M1]|nr:hypothetical protein GYMLUDRAFT_69503 [Collybiopsis luxurians FD-317 M1]
MSLVSPDLMTNKISTNAKSGSTLSGGRVVYPSPPLTPLLISRDHPRWCTERFTFSKSRISNWDECLWQFSLDGYGRISVINATVEAGVERNVHSNDFAVKIYQQLSSRLRVEMCDLSMKKIPISSSRSTKLEQKIQWLKHFCRQAS